MKWTLLKNQLCAQYIMTSLHHCKKVTFNNCIVKWRLGAQNIQELPQLAASSQMETSPMAGKSWQPSHESPHRKGKQAPITLNKQWKEEGRGRENCLDNELTPPLTTLQVHTQGTHKNASNKEYMEFRHMCICKKNPDYQRMLMLFVANSVKLHLTL